jgi:cell division protein FtsL
MAALRIWGIGFLFMALLVSAIAVVYYHYQAQLIFIEIQKQQNALEQYEIEWGKSQLELTTLTRQKYVESAALKQLNLVTPKHEEIIYLKP